jgi:hypothetical protein
MTSTTLLPFQPDAMTLAQLAAVSYLARYTGHPQPTTAPAASSTATASTSSPPTSASNAAVDSRAATQRCVHAAH